MRVKINAITLATVLAFLIVTPSGLCAQRRSFDASAELTARVRKVIEEEHLRISKIYHPGYVDEVRRIKVKELDVSNDGKKTIFVFFEDACGTGGCAMYVISHDLKIISKHSVVQTPVVLDAKLKNGRHIIKTYSGGAWREFVCGGRKNALTPYMWPKSNPPEDSEIIFGY